MALNKDIAAILELVPKMPSLYSIDVATLRANVNQMTAGAPRYEVPLAGIEDRSIAAPGHDIPVRIYTPLGEKPFPVVVYYHGGGFVIGDLNMSDAICRAIASGAKCLVVSIDYRLAPEHPYPTPNDDAWAALQWVAANAAGMGGDPARIAVCGDSAGANLSTCMTLRARAAGLHLIAQALLYPAPDYPDLDLPSYREFPDGPMVTAEDAIFYWAQYLPNPQDRENPDAAAARAKDFSGLPPAFVSTAECDPSRDTGEAYGEKLRAAGVPVVARRYAGMPHGFYAWVQFVPAVQTAMTELCEWLTLQFTASTH